MIELSQDAIRRLSEVAADDGQAKVRLIVSPGRWQFKNLTPAPPPHTDPPNEVSP